MRKPFLFILLCISLSQLYAQSELPAMGFYSEEERNLSVCAFDKDAEAVVLLDHAVSDHDEDYNLITTRQSETFKLNKNQVFTEKVNDYFSLIKFALPAVKAGSIIEYTYTSVMKSYSGLDNWIFQSDIPTLKSLYHLTVIPTAEFTYVVSKKEEYPIIVNQEQRT